MMSRWPESSLVVVLAGVGVAFLWTGLGDGHGVAEFFGVDSKKDALEFLGVIMGGLLVGLNVVLSHRRAKAMETAAAAQAAGMARQAESNELTEVGQRQERMKNAIDHLGSGSAIQRIGASHELVHLAKDTPDFRATVLAILCAYIRQTTGAAKYRRKNEKEPSTEIQSLLTLLFVREASLFRRFRANLEEAWLNGADLRGARLFRANLRGVYLEGARLGGAHLNRAILVEAWLRGAKFEKARLRECDLTLAHLQGARLTGTRLQGATVLGGRLVAAYCRDARFQGADLTDARLHAAVLPGAQMQAARMDRTLLQGAILSGADLRGAGSPRESSGSGFAERVRAGVGEVGSFSREGCGAYFGGAIEDPRAQQARCGATVSEAQASFLEPDRSALGPASFSSGTTGLRCSARGVLSGRGRGVDFGARIRAVRGRVACCASRCAAGSVPAL